MAMTTDEYMQHCRRTWHQADDTKTMEYRFTIGSTLQNIHHQSLWAEYQKKLVFMGRESSLPPDSIPRESECAIAWNILAHRVPNAYRQVHALLGLAGEWGEVMRCLPGQIAEVRDELGDMLYYLTMLAHEHGLTLDEVMTRNVEKLRERYPVAEHQEGDSA
jgi:NTP pyrophosphatase (non-canonical NTP hydrolase)